MKKLGNSPSFLFYPLKHRNISINQFFKLIFTFIYNRDSLDWKDYGVESIIDTVCNHKELGNGSIILCHNGAKYTADALDTMLTNLENQGYTIGTISDLILTEDYHMDVTGRQIPDKKNDMKNQASEIETETERKKKE